jgi:hypothetical protein
MTNDIATYRGDRTLADDKHITVEHDGQVLSQAIVSPADQHHEARAHVHVAPGHLPAGTHQQMADAILEAVTQDHAERLTASVPRGEAELVENIRDHLTDVELRSAGASSIIQGDVRPTS